MRLPLLCTSRRTSRSQLGLDQHRPGQGHGARHQRGTAGTRKDNAVTNNRPRAPARSNSADNLDMRHIRAHAAAEAARAAGPAGLGQQPRPTVLTPPLSVSTAAPATGVTTAQARAGAPTEAADISDRASGAKGPVEPEPEAAQSSSRVSSGSAQEPRTPSIGHHRPVEASSATCIEPDGHAAAQGQPQPVRTLADAVRQGPSRQRGAEQQPQQHLQQQQQQQAESTQHQPGPAPTTPTKAQLGPYSSALLGLSRPQRSPVSGQSLSPPSAASRCVAAGSPKGPLHPGSSPPASHRSASGAGAQGRSRADASADGGRPKGAQEASQPAAQPALPKQPQTPPPAAFALSNEGDFPQLGAVKTRKASRRGNPGGQSPAGSAAQTPVADSKPTSPSFSTASTPVTATGAKRVWAGNSAGLLQSAGNSPAGWPSRCNPIPCYTLDTAFACNPCSYFLDFHKLLHMFSATVRFDKIRVLAGRMQRQRLGRGRTRQMQAAQAGRRAPAPWQAAPKPLRGRHSRGRQPGEAPRPGQLWAAVPL